jgi:hypothetical protein
LRIELSEHPSQLLKVRRIGRRHDIEVLGRSDIAMKPNGHPADDQELDALLGERFDDSANIEFRRCDDDVRPQLPGT